MPISTRCPGCNAKLNAPDAAAGRTLNCPGCKTPVTMPRPSVPDLSLDAPSPPVAAPKPNVARVPPPVKAPVSMELDDMPKLKDDTAEDFEVIDEVEAVEELPVDSLDELEEVDELEGLDEVLPVDEEEAYRGAPRREAGRARRGR
jgi:hypothetical protein